MKSKRKTLKYYFSFILSARTKHNSKEILLTVTLYSSIYKVEYSRKLHYEHNNNNIIRAAEEKTRLKSDTKIYRERVVPSFRLR